MEQKKCSGGMGMISTLTLAFIVLKLTGRIDWPWIWVLSPIWLAAALLAVIFGSILVAGRIVKGKW